MDVTQSLVVYHFCWVHIWEDDEGEKEMWASVICPATYLSTVISSVNIQQLGARKCSPWGASGCKNIFIIFRNTWLTGCVAGRKWTWIDLCTLLLFPWLTACLYLSSWLLNVLCHTGSTKVNTLKVSLQLFEWCMIYYSAFTYLSYWVQPASVNVITKSLCLQDNDKFPGEKREEAGPTPAPPSAVPHAGALELFVYKIKLCLSGWIQASTCWSDEVKSSLHQQYACGILEACRLIWNQLIINCSTEAKAPCWPEIIRLLPTLQRNNAPPGFAGRIRPR